MCPFNGTLIHSSVVGKIGLPRSDFFIWGDEVDYFLRIRTVFPFATVIDSYLFHPESDADPRKMPAWKFLYRLRNQLFISSRHGRLRPLRILKNLALLFARKPDSVSAGLFAGAALQGILGHLGRRPEWIADSSGRSLCA
jgi:GT2 family glycosyltransferase